jgi:hypothetical protein
MSSKMHFSLARQRVGGLIRVKMVHLMRRGVVHLRGRTAMLGDLMMHRPDQMGIHFWRVVRNASRDSIRVVFANCVAVFQHVGMLLEHRSLVRIQPQSINRCVMRMVRGVVSLLHFLRTPLRVERPLQRVVLDSRLLLGGVLMLLGLVLQSLDVLLNLRVVIR